MTVFILFDYLDTILGNSKDIGQLVSMYLDAEIAGSLQKGKLRDEAENCGDVEYISQPKSK